MSTLPLTGRPALLGAVVAGTSASVLLWANVNATRVRALNAASLVCVALTAGGLEIAARYSPAGAAWNGTAGRLTPDELVCRLTATLCKMIGLRPSAARSARSTQTRKRTHPERTHA